MDEKQKVTISASVLLVLACSFLYFAIPMFAGSRFPVWSLPKFNRSAKNQRVHKQLTLPERIRQIPLLDAAIAAHERGEFVGALVSEYQELFDLANYTTDTNEGRRYEIMPGLEDPTGYGVLPKRLDSGGTNGPLQFAIHTAGTPPRITSVESKPLSNIW